MSDSNPQKKDAVFALVDNLANTRYDGLPPAAVKMA